MDVVERLLAAADEIAGWGAGNEAKVVREAVSEITRLRSERDSAFERAAKVADEFNYVVADRKTKNSEGRDVNICRLLNETEIVRGIASSIRSLKGT